MMAVHSLRRPAHPCLFATLELPVVRRTSRFKLDPSARHLSSSAHWRQQQSHDDEPFRKRLGKAWRGTKVQWYPIPVGLGIAFLGCAHYYRSRARQNTRDQHTGRSGSEFNEAEDGESGQSNRKRKRIRPSGPWQIKAMYILPLKAMSRLWGRFNELEIPYYLRVPGFKLYAWIFGVNLSEVGESDLHSYPNLAAFFYRTLKPGCRPLDPDPRALLSPADGRVLQFGTIVDGEVEQIKGMTYRLDALLGSGEPATSPNPSAPSNIFGVNEEKADKSQSPALVGDENPVQAEEEFARVNGISYTLPDLFSGSSHRPASDHADTPDLSTTPRPSSEAEVRADLALGDDTRPWYARITSQNKSSLYYVVIYLAPGDYHRFHSPTAWVAERRRHFAGELFSVSPYLQRTLPGLFTLNERVVLLGRWRWGFFSFIPVGATNVGSIKINFDRELRTNSLLTDTEADKAAEKAASRGEVYTGYAEANYQGASKLLKGFPLKRGEEIGGFQLGSSIVMVFEAPARRIALTEDGQQVEKGGLTWAIEQGQRVKVGQALGWVEEL